MHISDYTLAQPMAACHARPARVLIKECKCAQETCTHHPGMVQRHVLVAVGNQNNVVSGERDVRVNFHICKLSLCKIGRDQRSVSSELSADLPVQPNDTTSVLN